MSSPTCQRRHYEFFASTIREERRKVEAMPPDFERAVRLSVIENMTQSLGTKLAADNSNFRFLQFTEACR